MGAYLGALDALGLSLEATPTVKPDRKALAAVLPEDLANADTVPAAIPIQQYPQLRQLAWHVRMALN